MRRTKRKGRLAPDFYDIWGKRRGVRRLRFPLSPPSSRKAHMARLDYANEVNDPSLRPKPSGKRPKRNEKRRPSKPGRR